MFIDPASVNLWVLVLGWLGFAGWIAYSVLTLPWCMCMDTPLGKALPAFVVGLLVLWLIKAGVHNGLEIHLLGLTAFTLMFRCRLAIIGVACLYCLLAMFGITSWASVGVNGLLVGVAPILFSAFIHRAIYRLLPHNLFIFVFLNSFVNGALTMLITIAGIVLFLLLFSNISTELIQHQFATLAPLLVFPEAFINGGIMVLLVIYRPQWVALFDQDEYLKN